MVSNWKIVVVNKNYIDKEYMLRLFFLFKYLYNYFIPPHEGDFYYLALLKHNSSSLPCSIHGLWSNYADGSYPTFCKNVEFDMSKLESISGELKKYWPSRDGDDSKFYEHEYKKHGTCIFTEMTELEYFKKTLEMYHYVVDNNIYQQYEKKDGYFIPFDLNFNIIRMN